MSIFAKWYQIQQKLSSVLFPNNLSCVVCNQECGEMICQTCRESLPCDTQVRKDIAYVKGCYAPFTYDEPIRELIHRFKYNNQQYLASFFASYMTELITPHAIVVPVPLHKERLKQRGYSQTHRLAQAMVSNSQLYLPELLLRVRNTPSQTTLDAEQRKTNIQEAFSCNSKHISPLYLEKDIYLIDDVVSTGSTLLECAKVLSDAGFQNIYACVIAT